MLSSPPPPPKVDADNCQLDPQAWHKTAATFAATAMRPAVGFAEPCDIAKPLLPRSSIAAWAKAVRPHQWVKNLLILLPLIASHRILEPALFAKAAIVFLVFCFCASAIYIVNDLIDIEADRRHPIKRRRPFAAGDLSITQGVIGAALLLAAGLTLALFVGAAGLAFAATYVGLTFAYSLYFKKRLAFDVFVLAGLYVFRIVAGGIILGVPLSNWLLGFCGFFFLSLSFVKRFVELRHGMERGMPSAPGRAYLAVDREIVAMQGIGTGMAASVLLTLYVASDAVKRLYTSPELLWAWVPMILYWQCRIWTIANRGHMDDDPVSFAVRDKVTYSIAFAFLTILVLAAICDTSRILADLR